MNFGRSPAGAIVSSVALMSVSAFAADEIVKPAPTPPPSAGPTVAAAQAFCGEAAGKADELFQRYSADLKLKQVYKSADYVAFADDDKNPTAMFTFTVPGHPAHPTAVCRKIEKVGEAAVIKMFVVCDGAAEPCDKLRNDFNVMLAKMQVEVDQKIAEEKK
ncbi:MAG: hypothetical protein ACKVP4_06505 [Hyphomicrobium sp.]